MDIHSFDKYIFAFSGGKDSIACVLHMIEQGVDTSKMELWHHDIDGRGEVFMDWESTPAYCRAFAKAFNIPIYFSWKEGGFKREMLRNETRTAPTVFEVPEEEFNGPSKATRIQEGNSFFFQAGGIKGKPGTRMKFPQISPDLTVRWCSAYLKIDICEMAIRNQERFKGIKTLVISGERGEESPAREKYAVWEADRADLRDGKTPRFVERHRSIKDWKEKEVWAIMERFKVRAHPAYYLGFGRLSCRFCIFGNPNQFASAYAIAPKQGEELIALEEEFGVTMKRGWDLRTHIEKGTPYEMDPEMIEASRSEEYNLPIIMEEPWILPAGAFGESCGPM